MIRCVVVDDEPLAISLLHQYIRQYEGLEMLDGFTDAIESIQYVNSNQVDILFLDILMPDITGIEVLRRLNKKPVVIFTSAHRDFALDGYEMGVVDYLLKPFSFDRFRKAVEKAVDFIRLKEEDNDNLLPGVFVKSEYRLVKINFQDIIYIESMDDYIRIHLEDSRPVITLMSLKSFIEKLPPADFFRTHRRYIVAVKKIKSVGGKKLLLKNEIEIPVGNTYQQIVRAFRNRH